MSTQLDLFENDEAAEKFLKFHSENPKVYAGLKEIVFEAIGKGYKRFSIEAAYVILRWKSNIQTKDSDYKLNNIYRAFYARLFVNEYPEYRNLFEFRKSKSNLLLNQKQ